MPDKICGYRFKFDSRCVCDLEHGHEGDHKQRRVIADMERCIVENGNVTGVTLMPQSPSDAEVASRVRMLLRWDWDHELVCVLARDRIMQLSDRVKTLEGIIAKADSSVPEKRGSSPEKCHHESQQPVGHRLIEGVERVVFQCRDCSVELIYEELDQAILQLNENFRPPGNKYPARRKKWL